MTSPCQRSRLCRLVDGHDGECEEFDPFDYAMDGGCLDVAAHDPDGDP